MKHISHLSELHFHCDSARKNNKKIALIPTMGALHDGHFSLIKLAQRHADFVIVTIFVNKAQFNNINDFEKYPRDDIADINALKCYDIDLVYTPTHDAIYPQGFATKITLPSLSHDFCGAHREGHFDGVALIVSKLFNQIRPDIVVFGEKDWQQLAIIKQLNRDLDFNITILEAPTIRDDNGLALSSRNQRLSSKHLKIAPLLYHHLQKAREQAYNLTSWQDIYDEACQSLYHAGFGDCEYFALCDSTTLARLDHVIDKPMRILAAIYLGDVRLIDNISL